MEVFELILIRLCVAEIFPYHYKFDLFLEIVKNLSERISSLFTIVVRISDQRSDYRSIIIEVIDVIVMMI